MRKKNSLDVLYRRLTYFERPFDEEINRILLQIYIYPNFLLNIIRSTWYLALNIETGPKKNGHNLVTDADSQLETFVWLKSVSL